jgi:hypothetical protein
LAVLTLQSRLGSRNGFSSGMNTRRCPGPGARSRRGGIGIISADFFVEGAGAKASRLPPRRVRVFSEFLPLPPDASGTYRPNPQATTKPSQGPPSLKGYQ